MPVQTLSPCDQLSDAPANMDVFEYKYRSIIFTFQLLNEFYYSKNIVHFCFDLVLISVEEAVQIL